jgi:hypothetical protein
MITIRAQFLKTTPFYLVIVHFLCLPEENQSKERPPGHALFPARSQDCLPFENSLRSTSSNCFYANLTSTQAA